MPRTALQTLITEVHNIWSTGKTDHMPQVFAADFVCHLPAGWHQPDLHGPGAMAQAITDHRLSFPDWTEAVQDMIIDGPKVVSRFTATGTQTGPFMGLAPTGRRVTVDEIAIFHVRNGQVAEQWFLSDDLALDHQLRG